MSFSGKHTGTDGEVLAVKHLQEKGFVIVQTNYSCKLGEIDIIARKDDKLHFIEVKTRIGLSKGYPHEAITVQKLQHIKNTISFFLLQNKIKDSKLSIDVVSIVLNRDKSVEKLKLYENITLA